MAPPADGRGGAGEGSSGNCAGAAIKEAAIPWTGYELTKDVQGLLDQNKCAFTYCYAHSCIVLFLARISLVCEIGSRVRQAERAQSVARILVLTFRPIQPFRQAFVIERI